MSFNLAPGSIHTVQTPSGYFGYRSLRNMGDHASRWKELQAALDSEGIEYTLHTDWEQSRTFTEEMYLEDRKGIHIFLFDRIFPSVYLTNLLMRISDLMITKPSELSFFPVPKLFIQRVGRHEAWGAIRGAEIGDGTLETENTASMMSALKLTVEEDDLIAFYCQNIIKNKQTGVYNGAYNVIRLAVDARKHHLRGEADEPGAAVG